MAGDKLVSLRVPTVKQSDRKRNKLAKDDPLALFKALAMNIGKNVVAYVDWMYPEAPKACSSTFRLSLRNSIYNEIMAAMELNEEGQIIAALKDQAEHRRTMKSLVKKIRSCKCHEGGDPATCRIHKGKF
jgi:hypothetical protein